MNTFSNLRDELLSKRADIFTESMGMSIGELMSLYENDEINLEPAFQRLFRWSEQQQTNFIESILLGYPIPSVFVLQRKDGVWDVIDGVQRLSTIYRFTGILKNKETLQKKEPLQLEKAKILDHLEGKYFNEALAKGANSDAFFDIPTRIDFKRGKISVLIIKHGTEKDAKYELFKRLNTGGTHLVAQEMRNALILMYNEDVFDKMHSFCRDDDVFKTLLNIPETKLEQCFDMEVLTRFIIMRHSTKIDTQPSSIDANEFFDEEIQLIIQSAQFNIDQELGIFKKLIEFLSENVDEEYGFRIYNTEKNKFIRNFNWFIFEQIIFGLNYVKHIDVLGENEHIVDKIKALMSIGEYQTRENLPNQRVLDRMRCAKKEAQRVFSNGN